MGIYGNFIKEHNMHSGSLLLEAYFGKSQTLLELEDKIGELRDNYNYFQDYKQTDEIFQINRLFEKQFGMDIFSLHVVPSKIKNAYTTPVATRFDIALDKNTLKKRVHFDKKNGYTFEKGNGLAIICTVYAGLLQDRSITNAEIVAVLLHELGHNFADAIDANIAVANKNLVMYRIYFMIINALSSCGATLPADIALIYYNLNSAVASSETDPTPHPIITWFNGIGGIIDDKRYTLSEFIERITFASGTKISKFLSLPVKIFKTNRYSVNRRNETLADKFCGIYGYGPEQASVLAKMTFEQSDVERFVENIPLFGPLMNASYAKATKNLDEYDCHPHVIQRLNSELDTLNYELSKKNVDPKLEKVIRQQVKELEELKDKITAITTDQTKAQRIYATYAAYVDRTLPRGMDKKIEMEIDKALDNI